MLISHLRMTGKYFFEKNSQEIALIFFFANGKKLIYCDPRGFGVFHLQPSDTFKSLLPYREIGPDLIQEQVTPEYLFSRFQSLRMPIKSALLEQKIMSGIGNIYASEILFDTKIYPLKKTNQLTESEVKDIIFSAQTILKEALK